MIDNTNDVEMPDWSKEVPTDYYTKVQEKFLNTMRIAGVESINPIMSFVRTHPDAQLPTRKRKDILTGDTGYDLVSVEEIVIPANSALVVNVGLTLGYITPGYWIRIESRSGLQFKNSISAFNGIIDNTYRGDLGVRLINSSQTDYTVHKGDRIAQIVIYPLLELEAGFIEEVRPTERGDKGFGSSGT